MDGLNEDSDGRKTEAAAGPRLVEDDADEPTPNEFRYVTGDAIGIARRIVEAEAERILVVDPRPEHAEHGEPTAYWLEPDGIWNRAAAPWELMVHSAIRALMLEAAGIKAPQGMTPPALRVQRSRLRRGLVEEVRRHVATAAIYMELDGDRRPNAMTRCREDELDADADVLGVANGALSLVEARLLEPEEAKAKLVTRRAPTCWNAAAKHWAVEKLFGSWAEQGVFLAVALGHALRGMSGKRFYLLEGEPDCGKSTLARAMAVALGPVLNRQPMDNALGKAGERSAHTAGLDAWGAPTRTLFLDEADPKLAAPLFKRITGDGDFTHRPLRKDPITLYASATTFLLCNPQTRPKLALADVGVQNRIVAVALPSPDAVDPGLKPALTKDPAAAEALLARLVLAAKGRPTTTPPARPKFAKAFGARLTDEELEELALFGRERLRRTGGKWDRLAVGEAWEAWADWNDADAGDNVIGDVRLKGIGTKACPSFSAALASLVPGLGRPKRTRKHGRTTPCWHGWALEDAPTPEEDR